MSRLDEHVDELHEELGAPRDDIRASLETLVSYTIPIEEAKESLRRKYGGSS